jgi:hypothetical protein
MEITTMQRDFAFVAPEGAQAVRRLDGFKEGVLFTLFLALAYALSDSL